VGNIYEVSSTQVAIRSAYTHTVSFRISYFKVTPDFSGYLMETTPGAASKCHRRLLHTGLIYKLDGPTPRWIQSGDVISFATHDPEKLPLPSFDLLDRQWALHRGTAVGFEPLQLKE
jgi:hypothetical protein